MKSFRISVETKSQASRKPRSLVGGSGEFMALIETIIEIVLVQNI